MTAQYPSAWRLMVACIVWTLGVALAPHALLAERPVAAGVPLTVINHGESPVYATTVDLPWTELKRAGLATGRPVEVVTASGRVLPVQPLADRVRVFLSLLGGEQSELVVRAAERWPSLDGVVTASSGRPEGGGRLRNGVIDFNYEDGRWALSFLSAGQEQADAAVSDGAVLKECRMSFWLDAERRGRLMGMAADRLTEMGLIPSEQTRLRSQEAKTLPDGSAELTLTHGFEGAASDVTWTETFTLVAGEPVLRYNVRFATTGPGTRYLAYVDHGAGVHGEYGRLLHGKTRFKYENPKAADRVLLAGKENSFLRLGWRGERCWVGVDSDLGVGVGISTSRNVNRPLPGSSVWAISQRDFFARVIDTEQEHLPYAFSAEKPLELGFAFVATNGGVGVWGQTKQLFAAVTTGKTPRIGSSCAVYLEGRPIKTGETTAFTALPSALERLPSKGKATVAALHMDFDRPYRLVATAAGVSAVSPLVMRVLPGDGRPTPVATWTWAQAGTTSVDFTGATGWLGKRQSFLIEVEGRGEGARLTGLRIEPAGLAGPELDSPADGMSLTDLAAFFRWKQVKGALDYELQLAREATFRDPVTVPVRSEIDWPYHMLAEDALPQPGEWFWRVRAVEAGLQGEWSEARRIVINSDHGIRPVVRPISPQNPLFTLEAFRAKDLALFANAIPDDIKPYVAINCSAKFNAVEFLQPLQASGQLAFVRTHGPVPMSNWMPLAEVERVFQLYPNVIGIMAGETLTTHYRGGEAQRYVNRLLKLCGKYGRIYYDADGTYPSENKWETLYQKEGALMKAYASHLVFAQKNNILHRQFVSQSSVLGLYLAGDILAQGAWEDGGWYWEQVGFRQLGEIRGQRGGTTKMPRNFWNLNFLMGIARGCSVFSFEGQTGTIPVSAGWRIAQKGLPAQFNASAYWTNEGELTETFYRYCLPFMRAVIRQGLIPDRDTVLKNIRLAVYNDGVRERENGDPYYYQWEGLFRGTYGFRDIGVYPGTLMEFFPNTGRYYYIPVFPQGRVTLTGGAQTLPLSELVDSEQVRQRFDAAYPEWYQGEALVTLVGDTLAILNSRENEDVTERFAVPLKQRDLFQAIAGEIAPHAYVMGRFHDGNQRLWLQANAEYPERPTRLTLTLVTAPKVTVTPAHAATVNRWDERTKTLLLELSHADGAVEVEISSK